MSVNCGCMDMWLILLMQILLTRFYQRGSLVSGGGQWVEHVSWLQQVDQHVKEMGMDQASAWGMASLRLLEYQQRVDTVMCCSGACSHT